MSVRDFAIVIGIRDYAHLIRLDGALEDATEIRNWLLSYGEVPEENLHCVLGDGKEPGQPAVERIEEAFEMVLDGARAKGARRLYVYFAGHGLSRTVSRLSLLAADARSSHLNKSIDSQAYHEALCDLPLFPEQIFWYDCCRKYDWRISGRPPSWTPWDPPQPPPSGLMQMVHYATGFNDAANERPHLGVTRGLFTRALLEGLRGAAAPAGDHGSSVTAEDLGLYVKVRVEDLARQAHLSQIPEPRYIGQPAQFVIVESVTPVTQRVEVAVGAGAGELCVRDAQLDEVERHPVADGDEIVVLNLMPGRYEIERLPQNRRQPIEVQPAVPALAVDLGGSS